MHERADIADLFEEAQHAFIDPGLTPESAEILPALYRRKWSRDYRLRNIETIRLKDRERWKKYRRERAAGDPEWAELRRKKAREYYARTHKR